MKEHFDHIMSEADPSYMEDTYGRGVWIRVVARFGLEGLKFSEDYEEFKTLAKIWKAYYGMLYM